MFQLETERLTLEEITPNEDQFIYNLLNSPTWLKYIGDRNVRTFTDARRYIEDRMIKSYRENGFGLWLTKLKSNDEPIGICGLVKRPSLEDVDVGFGFLPAYQSKGYGYESAAAVMEYAKENLKLKRIVAITVSYNHASIALLKKIGLSFEKIIKIANDDEELMLFGIIMK